MSIIFFFIILLVLVMVHELGHFVVAKLTGMRVDEFGIGFPPTIWKKKYGETEYKINSLPLGGYVKIYGENGTDDDAIAKDDPRAFGNRPKVYQVLVLLAGVAMNWVLAFLIFLLVTFLTPQLASVDNLTYKDRLTDIRVEVLGVQPDSPAAVAGLASGDRILKVSAGQMDSVTASSSIAQIKDYINVNSSQVIKVEYSRDGNILNATMTAADGILEGKKAIGIMFDKVGAVELSSFEVFKFAGFKTWDVTKSIFWGTIDLFKNLSLGHTDALKDVSGPIGIAKVVGDASSSGSVFKLLLVTAMLSVNLAVFNLLPFPALDGGRIVVVLIEAIIRRKVSVNIQAWVNGIGFLILIGLMIFVSVSDVFKFIK